MRDYQVKVSIKNGRILGLMRAAGIESQSELARMAGVTPALVGAIINLKLSPRRARDGQWRNSVLRVAGVLQCDPEDLFTEAQSAMQLTANHAVIEMDEREVAQLMSSDVENNAIITDATQKLLSCLSPREKVITEAIMNGASMDEASDDDGRGCGSARMGQIYKKSLRKMKHRAKRLGLTNLEQIIQ